MKIKTRMSSGYISESFTSRASLKRSKPPRALKSRRVSKSGRDELGHVSVRHQGGGSIRMFREISTLERLGEDEVKVIQLEYDPNRTAHLALVELKNKSKKYIISPDKVKAGDILRSGERTPVKRGNRMMLKNIPIGSAICDIQMYPEAKKYIARSAGTSASLMAIEGGWALLKLPSGELRKLHENCFATLGSISNPEHSNITIGTAGRKRRMGIRPTVRGKVMSPKAHPHGGGEGVNPIGLKYPKTPWGKVAIGKRTRRNKLTGKFIVKRRKNRK